MNAKRYLQTLFKKALDEMSPEEVIRKTVSLNGGNLQIRDVSLNIEDRPMYLFAVGKAAIPMTSAVIDMVCDQITDSLIIAPEDNKIPGSFVHNVIFGSHPTPTVNSLKAGMEAVAYFEKIPENAILLSLISGGTSSLMCLPADPISIDDLSRTYQLLINSRANIHEINTVRKHCSLIKGGQLLRNLNPSVSLINLFISDVPDDILEDIGSGPTVPDSSNFQDAHEVLVNYELWEKIPENVREHIEKGLVDEVPETLKKEDDPQKEHYSFIISSAPMLADRIAEIAAKDGYATWVADKPFTEDVKKVASDIAEHAIAVADGRVDVELPALLVYYGESTVNVTGSGKGGRNQELALRGALNIAGYPQITWLSVGTDGIDGPTDAAGAIVDGNSIQKSEEIGLNASTYLEKNDSYHFHERLGTLLRTGPTGNNLMDVVLILIK